MRYEDVIGRITEKNKYRFQTNVGVFVGVVKHIDEEVIVLDNETVFSVRSIKAFRRLD
jgi:hypothetical protein